MSFQLTQRVIKLLCGPFAYERGEAYHRSRKVTFSSYDAEGARFDATVHGNLDYQVNVEIDSNGDVSAQCGCPAFLNYNNYCKHIAAVLLNIHDIQHAGRAPVRAYSPSLLQDSRGSVAAKVSLLASRYAAGGARPTDGLSQSDHQLMSGILGLFGAEDRPQRPRAAQTVIETRALLDVSFIVKPFPYSFRKYMFGIELKVGPKRLYIVQKIREFLDRIDRREAYAFSKNFTYEPDLHAFGRDNDAILGQLIQIYRNEKMVRETLNAFNSSASGMSGDRMLLLPPTSWEPLLPLLSAAPSVQLELGEETYEGIRVSDEPLPLRFAFDEAEAGADGEENYQLDVQGLGAITVMEAYGVALYDGKLIKLPAEQSRRLGELKQMIDSSRRQRVRIPKSQMEPFMERVIPGLAKLGEVNVAPSVAERIVRTPLKARLYLDRVRDRLLAGLEFQYDDVTLNPLEDNSRRPMQGRILIRDLEKEGHILALMDSCPFLKTESGYFMDEEEAEYDFLYNVVPQLELMLQVYATSAVKARLHVSHAPPRIRVEFDERTDWLDCRFELDGFPEAELREVLRSLEEKRKYHRLSSGALVPLETSEFREIGSFIDEMGVRVRKLDLDGAAFKLPAVRGLHLLDAEQPGDAVKLGKKFRQLLENLKNPDNLDFQVPERLAPVLREYQKFGYQWLKTLAHYRFGGILADDMGLGKTLQSITYLVSVLPDIRAQGLPAIIVCPASLLYNWHSELNKFAPDVRAIIADGSKSERTGVLQETAEVDVIITSYPLLRRDVEEYAGRPFHTLILDEAQAFKNYATQTAQAVKEIQAKHRFALTGTPVENGIEELWSIYDAVFPELFQGKKAFGELSRAAVAKRIKPFLLRRLKKDVLTELPEKIETLQASDLLPEQKKLYLAYLAKLQKETLKHLSTDGFQKHRIEILAGLTRLRQLCCHPALFVQDYDGGSAKFDQLMEIVEECRGAGKRALIFSQFTQMLGIIGKELSDQGVPHFYLDGSTPSSERVELCNRFNNGERELFLISLKAGGTGLNLTGADTVILYDLWWNPAVEQQAADRAHRIGQKNVVQVIKLVTRDTVEEKMHALQQRKKQLVDEVIQPGQEALSTLSEQEIRDILQLG
ncbi:SNF2 helicase associated domain-containing protein [Cohnella yongneupensis]|uniref:SNF2 helicase associated domain-containing protein n=1 Tax=Cohnella yongneupensis TaxID=425006 RepID=A0ABW0R3V7_9BACL